MEKRLGRKFIWFYSELVKKRNSVGNDLTVGIGESKIQKNQDQHMECKKETNMCFCNCSYPGCDKKGICCECLKYHRQRGELPACYFPPDAEKTYDRSIEYFIKVWREKNV